MKDIHSIVVSALAERLCLEASEIKLTDTLREDLGMDSLSLVDFSLALEDALGNEASLGMDDLANITSVQSVIDLLTTRNL